MWFVRCEISVSTCIVHVAAANSVVRTRFGLMLLAASRISFRGCVVHDLMLCAGGSYAGSMLRHDCSGLHRNTQLWRTDVFAKPVYMQIRSKRWPAGIEERRSLKSFYYFWLGRARVSYLIGKPQHLLKSCYVGHCVRGLFAATLVPVFH